MTSLLGWMPKPACSWQARGMLASCVKAGAILWSLKKQHVVALSSTKTEYITQMHVAEEALWWHSFLQELHSAPDDPLTLNCNNQGEIALTKNNKFHTCTKYIDMRYHFIHEAVEDGKVEV